MEIPKLDEKIVLDFVDSQRKKVASKIANPYVFGALALWYAYKGKLGKIERTLIGLSGAVTLYSNYKAIESSKKDAGILDMLTEYAVKASGEVANDMSKKVEKQPELESEIMDVES